MPDVATLTCPKCGHEFELAEGLRHKLEEEFRDRIQRELSKHQKRAEAEIARRQKEVEARELATQELEKNLAKRVAAGVKEGLEKQREDARAEVEAEVAEEFKRKDERLTRLQEKVKEAQKFESEVRDRADKIEQEKAELEITLRRRLDEEKAKIQEEVSVAAAEQFKLKEIEYQEKIHGIEEKLAEAQKKASQGSQQSQGEALEILVERELAGRFPQDKLEPVPKGKPGADILQRVQDVGGRRCGTILWEAKRTKNWSDGWIAKIKDDQRAAKAEVAVIVSQALPGGLRSFDLVDGVIVSDYAFALPIASMLRERILDVDRIRRSEIGRAGKEVLVYEYLTSTEFRQTAQAIAESIVHARTDIEKERATFEKMWAKREAQLDKGLRNLFAMWGRMQGHIGSLPDLHPLATLEGPTEQDALPGDATDGQGNAPRSD